MNCAQSGGPLTGEADLKLYFERLMILFITKYKIQMRNSVGFLLALGFGLILCGIDVGQNSGKFFRSFGMY